MTAVHYLADGTNTAVASTLIATAGTVVAAGIAAVAAAFHRGNGDDNAPVLGLTQAYLDELIRRATAAEGTCDELTHENNRLRHLLIAAKINPEDGEKL